MSRPVNENTSQRPNTDVCGTTPCSLASTTTTTSTAGSSDQSSHNTLKYIDKEGANPIDFLHLYTNYAPVTDSYEYLDSPTLTGLTTSPEVAEVLKGLYGKLIEQDRSDIEKIECMEDLLVGGSLGPSRNFGSSALPSSLYRLERKGAAFDNLLERVQIFTKERESLKSRLSEATKSGSRLQSEISQLRSENSQMKSSYWCKAASVVSSILTNVNWAASVIGNGLYTAADGLHGYWIDSTWYQLKQSTSGVADADTAESAAGKHDTAGQKSEGYSSGAGANGAVG